MEILRLEPFAERAFVRTAVALGNFDGVHRGHQALVAEIVGAAAGGAGSPAGATAAIVLTFDPHPARVLNPAQAPTALMTLEQKAEVLGDLGVSRLVVLPFDARLGATSAEDFARLVLREALGAARVVVGEGFRFGRGRAGDVPALERLGATLGFQVRTVAPVFEDGAPISSSRIRDLLGAGHVERAEALLGRPYFVDGTVVRGDGRGRGLGIPTANVAPRNETLPAAGVYACRVRPGAGGPFRAAVANLGRRPTFGPGASTLEAHLLDFEGDLYGKEVRLEFRARLRGERAFPGISELLDQVKKDISAARAFLEKAR